MTTPHTRIATRLLPLLLGLGAAAIVAGAVQAVSASTDPALTCEIRETAMGAMVALEPVVRSDGAVGGQYTFKVTSAGGAGNSNIRQGGGFSADGETTLGRVMLGNTGRAYEARLALTAGGRTVECAERIGGAI